MDLDKRVNMEQRILTYRKYIDTVLTEDKEQDWEALRREHLVQIGFFQHERLIHLLVTLAFAIFLMFSLLLCVTAFSPYTAALAVLILVLLIPYLHHYWVLENETQKMYRQYDLMAAKPDKAEGSSVKNYINC